MSCLFSVFLDCRQWTLDPYWQEIFYQCSIGKFPKGLFMSKDGSLIVYTKGQKEIVSIDGTSLDIFQVMMKIFKEKLNLVSNRDVKKQKKEILLLKEKLKESYGGTWKQIKPKKIRNSLLLNFVIDCKHKYKLSSVKIKQLFSVIKLGFIFKSINSDDIDYSHGKIHKIKGLTFFKNQDTYDFNFDIFSASSDEYNKLEKSLDAKQKNIIENYIKEYKSHAIRI